MPSLTTLQNIMKLPNEIEEYLVSRNFSENTRSNYYYDLVYLQAFFEDKSVTQEALELTNTSLVNSLPRHNGEKFRVPTNIFYFYMKIKK